MTLTTYTYDAIDDYLGAKNERPARYATTVRRVTLGDGTPNGCLVVRHHSTDIITLTPPSDPIPVVQLDTRGWHTVTTRDRLNDCLRADHGAGPLGAVGFGEHGCYSVMGPRVKTGPNRWDWSHTWAYHYAYGDGMVIDLRPGVTYGHPMPAHRIPVDRNGAPLNYAGPGPRRTDDELAGGEVAA